MHALGWSIDMAVDYMMEHSASSKENIIGEVNRYIDLIHIQWVIGENCLEANFMIH